MCFFPIRHLTLGVEAEILFQKRPMRGGLMRFLIVLLTQILMLPNVGFAGELADLHERLCGKEKLFFNSFRSYKEINSPEKEVSEIGIERSKCYGTCPVYSFIVKRDGSFRYNGINFVKRKGRYAGKVNLWQLNNILKFIKEIDYVKLDDKYFCSVSDYPTVFTTAVINGKRKIVSNYANAGPSKLWALEELIDHLMNNAVWDKKGKLELSGKLLGNK